MALFSRIVKVYRGYSLERCVNACSSSARNYSDCQSINLEMKEGIGQICELNNGTKEQHPELFRKRPGFIYYEQSI